MEIHQTTHGTECLNWAGQKRKEFFGAGQSPARSSKWSRQWQTVLKKAVVFSAERLIKALEAGQDCRWG